MNRPTLFRVVHFCLAWLVLGGVARGGGDFVILGERGAFWTNNRAAPVSKELARLQKQHAFRSVSFCNVPLGRLCFCHLTSDSLSYCGGDGQMIVAI